jgi:hypothetical protein
VNVLPPKVFRGEENPFANKRVGHISSSVNVPIEDSLVDDNRGMLRPAPELRVVVDNAGLSPEHETDVHCQAGARTAFGYFVLSVLGYDRVRAYDAAMAGVGESGRHTSDSGACLAMNAVLGRYAISRRNRQDSSPERRFGEGPVQGHLTQAVRGRNHVERPQCVFNTEGTAGLFQLRSAVLLW